jgi:NAD(P)-dependent dehydrogenase (short-subunit alcohol dehydrogenase family)
MRGNCRERCRQLVFQGENEMRLQGKSAIVTGGAAGIGKAIVEAFVREGADVAIFDLYLDKAQRAADSVAGLGPGKVHAIVCDVGFSDQVARAFAEANERLGGLDVLVNNAGLIRQSPVVETSEEDWDFIIRNNLKSVFLCSREAGRRMIAQGRGGRIIAISSIHAVLSEPNCCHYTAAKGGIEAFCRTLATELAPHKVTVNFVRPGATYTELTVPMYTESVKRALFERVSLKEIADASWIAAGVVFLASDDARYMTGQDLTIDGGYVMDGSLPGAKYWED